MSTIDDTRLPTSPAPEAREADFYYNYRRYAAFPHAMRLVGKKLMIVEHQAPPRKVVKRLCQCFVIALTRFYNKGESWDYNFEIQSAATRQLEGTNYRITLCSSQRNHEVIQ